MALVLVSLHCNGQKEISIGYWGGKEPAIENKYEYFASPIVLRKITANNRKLGTNTTIDIEYNSDYYDIKNSKYPNVKLDILNILHSLYKDFDGKTTFKVKDIIVLPNDNIAVFLTVKKTKVVGGYKLPDQIVKIDGDRFFVPGGYVPQKEESTSRLGLILDCKKKYSLHKAFYTPQYERIIPSVNSRIYFLSEGKKAGDLIWGYKTIHCVDYDGKYMWKYSGLKKDVVIYGIQEFKDNLYLQGSSKGDDGQMIPTSIVYDARNDEIKDVTGFTKTQGFFMAPSGGNDKEFEDVDYEGNESTIHIITKRGIEFRFGREKDNKYIVSQRQYLNVQNEDEQYLSIY